MGGIFIAFGTIKPQIALFVVMWLLFERRWKPLAVGAALALVMSLPHMIASGLIGAFTEWLSAIGRYQVNPFNTLGFIHVFGLQNLLATIGFTVPFLLPVGVAAIIGLWWSRFRVADSDILSLLIGLTLVFGFSHDYDVSAFAVALPAFWRHLRGKTVETLIASLLTFGLFLPQRIFWGPSRPQIAVSLNLSDALLVQYRVLVVLALVILLFLLSIKRSSDLISSPAGAIRQ